MSIKETRCIEVECDGCEDGWGDEDYGTPHWPVDTDIAEKAAECGWTTDDGKHYCRHCTATRTCARDGHQPHRLDAFGKYPAITICDRCNAFLNEHEQQPEAMTSADTRAPIEEARRNKERTEDQAGEACWDPDCLGSHPLGAVGAHYQAGAQ